MTRPLPQGLNPTTLPIEAFFVTPANMLSPAAIDSSELAKLTPERLEVDIEGQSAAFNARPNGLSQDAPGSTGSSQERHGFSLQIALPESTSESKLLNCDATRSPQQPGPLRDTQADPWRGQERGGRASRPGFAGDWFLRSPSPLGAGQPRCRRHPFGPRGNHPHPALVEDRPGRRWSRDRHSQRTQTCHPSGHDLPGLARIRKDHLRPDLPVGPPERQGLRPEADRCQRRPNRKAPCRSRRLRLRRVQRALAARRPHNLSRRSGPKRTRDHEPDPA